MENVHKFVTWEVPDLETLKETKVYQVMEKLNNGGKLTRDEKDSFDFNDGCFVKKRGWLFNFLPYCNRYLVKISGYGWSEVWHFDKTAIRSNIRGVTEIVELPSR